MEGASAVRFSSLPSCDFNYLREDIDYRNDLHFWARSQPDESSLSLEREILSFIKDDSKNSLFIINFTGQEFPSFIFTHPSFERRLEEVEIVHCSHLKGLPENFVEKCKNIRRMKIRDCNEWILFPKFSEAFKELYVENCKSVSCTSCFFYKNLRVMSFVNCINLIRIDSSVSGCTLLEELNFSNCVRLDSLPDLRECKKLKFIRAKASGLSHFPLNLDFCKELKFIVLEDCQALEDLPYSLLELPAKCCIYLSGCSDHLKSKMDFLRMETEGCKDIQFKYDQIEEEEYEEIVNLEGLDEDP